MSKRKRAQVEEDSSFEDAAEIDLRGENDLADIDVVSDVEDVVQPPAKKRKKNDPTLAKLKPLTKEEILAVLTTASEKHPEIVDYLATSMPKPSLDKTKELINKLERDYLKAFPYDRYGKGNSDTYAYNRVRGRLGAFKKQLVGKAMEIKAACEWDLLLDYVAFASDKATEMPVWDKDEHNKSRTAAIKKLIGLGTTVVKKLKKEKPKTFWVSYKKTFKEMGGGFEAVAAVM